MNWYYWMMHTRSAAIDAAEDAIEQQDQIK